MTGDQEKKNKSKKHIYSEWHKCSFCAKLTSISTFDLYQVVDVFADKKKEESALDREPPARPHCGLLPTSGSVGHVGSMAGEEMAPVCSRKEPWPPWPGHSIPPTGLGLVSTA